MRHRRMVVVDRDPQLLARLRSELVKCGLTVEALTSTVGLTPDLLALNQPDALLMDAELPGLEPAALLVITRSLKALRPVEVVFSTERNASELERLHAADKIVDRAALLRDGIRVLGLTPEQPSAFDLRALIDEVLGGKPNAERQKLEVRVDLFSKSNFYVTAAPGMYGVFVACQQLVPIGQKVELVLDLLGKTKLVLQGDVAWHRPHGALGGKAPTGVGIKLESVDEGTRLSIDRFRDLREPLTWLA